MFSGGDHYSIMRLGAIAVVSVCVCIVNVKSPLTSILETFRGVCMPEIIVFIVLLKEKGLCCKPIIVYLNIKAIRRTTTIVNSFGSTEINRNCNTEKFSNISDCN